MQVLGPEQVALQRGGRGREGGGFEQGKTCNVGSGKRAWPGAQPGWVGLQSEQQSRAVGARAGKPGLSSCWLGSAGVPWAHQLVGHFWQVGVPLTTPQYWALEQLLPQLGVLQLGVPVQPARQEVQPELPVQVAQLAPQFWQVGAPLTTPQNWLLAHLLPQSGCEQPAPFQPGAQAVQVVELVQVALQGGRGWGLREMS